MRFAWPKDTKCVVTLTFEFDAESVEKGFKDAILGSSSGGGWSPRWAVPQILELLKRYDIKATFFVSGWDAERYPETVRDIAAEGHEIAAHGYLFEDLSKLEPEEEKGVFNRAHKILSDLTGTPPRGFRNARYGRPISTNTLVIARELGYIYDSSFLDDDLPYQIKMDGKVVNMIEIPWVWPLNDLAFMSAPYSCGVGLVLPMRPPRWIIELWKDEFDSLYEEGTGFFNLVNHPRDIGRGSRIPILEELIHFIKAYDGIWFATCTELADWCLMQTKG